MRWIPAADTLICLRCSQNATQSLCNPTYPAASTLPTVNCNIASPGIAYPVPNHSIPAPSCRRACYSSYVPLLLIIYSGLFVRLAPSDATSQSISACRTQLPSNRDVRRGASLANLDICNKCVPW